MSPCVSTTVPTSRGGTTLLFYFFAYLHGRRHIRKSAAAGTFAKFPIELFIYILSIGIMLTERKGRRQRKTEGKGRNGHICLFVFFIITAKAGRRAGKGGRYSRFWQAGKEIPFLLQFPICLFSPRFEITEEKRGGECHSLTAVDSAEDWTGEGEYDELEEGKEKKRRKEKKRT